MLMIVRGTEMGKSQHFCRVRSISGNRGLLRSKKKPVPRIQLLFIAFLRESTGNQSINTCFFVFAPSWQILRGDILVECCLSLLLTNIETLRAHTTNTQMCNSKFLMLVVKSRDSCAPGKQFDCSMMVYLLYRRQYIVRLRSFLTQNNNNRTKTFFSTVMQRI